jgi:hypothetical protein
MIHAQYGAALFALLGVGVALWLRPQEAPAGQPAAAVDSR